MELTGVSKAYDMGGRRLDVLHEVNLSVPAESVLGIIGPSGCGKSTLLRIVCGLLETDRGRVELFGRSPEALRREHRIGAVFQSSALIPWKTAQANIVLPFSISGQKIDIDMAQSLLEEMGLTPFAQYPAHTLSNGMKQRVALARALILTPRVVLLDEPFGSLDELSRAEMNVMLARALALRNCTTVLVTHSIAEAVFLSDFVAVLSPRAAAVQRLVGIDVPRPRDRASLLSGRLLEATQHILELLTAGRRDVSAKS